MKKNEHTAIDILEWVATYVTEINSLSDPKDKKQVIEVIACEGRYWLSLVLPKAKRCPADALRDACAGMVTEIWTILPRSPYNPESPCNGFSITSTRNWLLHSSSLLAVAFSSRLPGNI